MSVLSDRDIEREMAYGHNNFDIDPYDENNVQPASYDLTLGNEWIVPVEAHPDDKPITMDEGLPQSAKRVFEAGEFVISPMQNPDLGPFDSNPFVLGHVQEKITLPDNITAEVKGRSSIGRLGVIPHTAGWGDPGFEGQLTLEFVNLSPNPITLKAGKRIAQVVFSYTHSESGNPYGEKSDSKYQGQTGVTESRVEQDSERGDE